MELKRGDVYLADFNETVRPVLILSNKLSIINSQFIIVVPITSNIKGKNGLDTIFIDSKKYDALKKDSVVVVSGIRPINKSSFIEKIFSLNSEDINKVEKGLSTQLGLVKYENESIQRSEMNVFQDFVIYVEDPKKLEIYIKFLKRKVEELSDYWNMHLENIEDGFMAIRKEKTLTTDSSILFLKLETDNIQIANIIPVHKSEMSPEEYNQIIIEFEDSFVKNSPVSLSIYSTNPKLDLNSIVDQEIVELLQIFSDTANKYTGSAHPQDKKRWHDFIIHSYLRKSVLPSVILKNWLIEIEHWPDNIAIQLTIEYENALNILKEYDLVKRDE